MEGLLEDMRQRAMRRSILLGEGSRREYSALVSSGIWAPYLAQSPNLPKTLLRQMAKLYPLYAARNPRTYEVPEALNAVIEAISSAPLERLQEPSSLEGKALRHLVANLDAIPKRKRRAVVELALTVGISLPDLGPRWPNPS